MNPKSRIILQEEHSGKNYILSLPCTIGRGNKADLSLTDQTVSHRHAVIDITMDSLWIQDLNSSNGTIINGEKIIKKTNITPGDSIQLGHLNFLFSGYEENDTDQTLILHSLNLFSETPIDQQRLQLVYNITSSLPEEKNVKELINQIFSRIKEYFKQDRGYLAIFQENGSLVPLCCKPQLDSVPLSRSIVKRIFENGESFVLTDALSHDSFKEQESIIAMQVRSAICAPLTYHQQIYGLIYLDRNIPGAYNQSDLELFCSIAAIITPLIENARLWNELEEKYETTVEKLRQTEARLIDSERIAAYSRLSQAMAHEIRNPLTMLGGLVRRIVRVDGEIIGEKKCKTILQSVERIEEVLKEVDGLTMLPKPNKKLEKIDSLVQEIFDDKQMNWQQKGLSFSLAVTTIQTMVPVDAKLLKKAISLLFLEVLTVFSGTDDILVTIQDWKNSIQICIGVIEDTISFGDPFAPELCNKPWCNSLFLNIVHKILLDHGGKLLLNVEGNTFLPLILLIPRTLSVEDKIRNA